MELNCKIKEIKTKKQAFKWVFLIDKSKEKKYLKSLICHLKGNVNNSQQLIKMKSFRSSKILQIEEIN